MPGHTPWLTQTLRCVTDAMMQAIWPRPSVRRQIKFSEHERWVLKNFGDKSRFSGVKPVFDHPLYCVVFTNRSGSNLLCDYLCQMPQFSGFSEMLNRPTIAQVSYQRQIKSFPDYIIDVTNRNRGSRPIYGFKASVEQLAMLIRCNIPSMYQGGLRVLHIRRQDCLGQAISYQIALQTRAWTSTMNQALPRDRVICDPNALNRIMEEISISNLAVEMLCETQNILRFELFYENLVATPDKTLHNIALFCGQDSAVWHLKPPTLSRQADALNQAFRSQYKAYMTAKFQNSQY